jgi:dolichol-phosphate mannosyltransferase
MTSRLFVIVPVFNEAENLETLFTSIRNMVSAFDGIYHTQIIMVNDGSTDDTAAKAATLASGLDFLLLNHVSNLGPGRAFATAFEWLATRLNHSDWVLTIEGDNTSRLEVVQQMFKRAEEGFEVILASIYIYGGGISNTNTLRVILSNIANTFVKEFLGIQGIMTVSSFFRLYQAPVLCRLQDQYGVEIIERRGFESMVEMVMKLVIMEATISEVPMMLDTSLRAGKSKMKIARTIMGYFALLGYKRKWRRMAGQ